MGRIAARPPLKPAGEAVWWGLLFAEVDIRFIPDSLFTVRGTVTPYTAPRPTTDNTDDRLLPNMITSLGEDEIEITVAVGVTVG
jgi:hypothetical protein